MAITTRTLGRTGADVTILGYGAMELRGQPRGPQIADEDAGRLLNAVLDGGINLIDTSPDYGRSEELIGSHIGHRRDEFFLASKCGCPIEIPADVPPPYPHDYSPANVRADVEQSLRRLRTDRLDLVQVHMSPSRARSRRTARSRRCSDCSARARSGSSGCRASCRTCPTTSRWTSSTPSRSRTRPCSATTRTSSPGGGAGAGTLIRGGAARGAASEEKNWRVGPLTQQPGLGQRNWETSGIADLLAEAGIPAMEFILRFTLSHPGLSTTIVGTANPAHLAATSPSRRRARCPPTCTPRPRSASRPRE